MIYRLLLWVAVLSSLPFKSISIAITPKSGGIGGGGGGGGVNNARITEDGELLITEAGDNRVTV